MIKAIFFDVANTLLDKPDLYPNMQSVLIRNGHTVDPTLLAHRHRLLSEVMEFPDKTSQDFYLKFNSQLLRLLGILPKEELVSEMFNACTYLPWKAFDDVKFLPSLSVSLGVISNWDKSLPEKLKELIDLKFDWIFGSEQMKSRKPDLNFYKNLVDNTGYSPHEILYVGDSIKLDIEPALAIGIQAVLIDRMNLFPNAIVSRMRSFKEIKSFI
jgi:FMN phosphatase YigB (HAD superfamily)